MITTAPTSDSLLAEAFDQTRSSAEANVAITARMIGAIHTIASLPHRRALDEPVEWIAELAERTIESAHVRARMEPRLKHVRDALEAEHALRLGQEQT